jgi:hypothetical protein
MISLGMGEVQRKCQSGSNAARKSGSWKNSGKKQSDTESGISSIHSQASITAPGNLAMNNH